VEGMYGCEKTNKGSGRSGVSRGETESFGKLPCAVTAHSIQCAKYDKW